MRYFVQAALILLLGCSDSFFPFSPDDGGLDSGRPDVPQVCRELPRGCDPATLIEVGCGTSVCHGAGNVNNVDLESGDVFARMVGTGFRYEGACFGEPLVSGAPAETSLFIRKLTGRQGSCGDRMPYGESTSNADIACFVAWIERETCLRSTPPFDAGPYDAGPDTFSIVDAGNPPIDAGPGCEAPPGVGRSGNFGADPLRISDEEAACLGIEGPCTSCHRSEGRYLLRLNGAPNDPGTPDPTAAECGVPRNLLCADEAECFGFDQPDCASCHVLNGVYYLRPWYAGPNPTPQTADPACYAPL